MPFPKYNNALTRVKKAITNDMLAHSYLVTGDTIEVIDKFIKEWMQYCLCENKNELEPCGVCDNCKAWKENYYPELRVLSPKSKSRSILVAETRNFQAGFNLKSGGRLKIGLIYDADRMVVSAQNSFLKTLEEPPPHTIFILISTKPNNLLNTIISRCQVISLNQNITKYDFEELPRLLETLNIMAPGSGAEKAVSSAQEIQDIFQLFRSRSEDAAKAYKEEISQAYANMDSDARKTVKAQTDAYSEALYKNMRESAISAIETWFSQIYLSVNDIPTDKIPNPDLSNPQNLSMWTVEKAENAIDVVNQFQNDLNGNVNESIAISNLCLQICSK